MELKKLMSIVGNAKGGQFHRIEWEKPIKTYKGLTDTVTKRTASVLRMGVTYDNKQAVIDKRNDGELPQKNAGLAEAYKWILAPYILENTKTNSIQLRVTTAENSKFDTQYFLNGKAVSKDELKGIALASELPSSGNMPDVLNLKVENIISIK
jgi:hypothetical protein